MRSAPATDPARRLVGSGLNSGPTLSSQGDARDCRTRISHRRVCASVMQSEHMPFGNLQRALWAACSCRGLPHAAESHGNRLAVHAPGSIAAQERDHLCDLSWLQHPVLRVDCGALAPNLLDTDAATFGFRLRRALGHCRSHPARQYGIGCDSEWPSVLRNRTSEPDNSMLGSGVRAAGAFRFLAGGRAGKYEPAEAALAHAAYGQARELERSVEIDAHRLAPHFRILLPHEPLVR